jgi:hypothetical protein
MVVVESCQLGSRVLDEKFDELIDVHAGVQEPYLSRENPLFPCPWQDRMVYSQVHRWRTRRNGILKRPGVERIFVFFNNNRAMLSNARAMRTLLEESV